jgi:biopolymer transport protein ExbD
VDIPRETRRARDLNLTPLVDIILMLVVFFMISTSFVASESMELSLPADGGKSSASDSSITRILILDDGNLYLNQAPMKGSALNSYLARLLAEDADARIAIFTTPGVTVQQLVSVMDMVYLTGGRNVQVDKLDEIPYGN